MNSIESIQNSDAEFVREMIKKLAPTVHDDARLNAIADALEARQQQYMAEAERIEQIQKQKDQVRDQLFALVLNANTPWEIRFKAAELFAAFTY